MQSITLTTSYNHLALLCDLHKVIGMLSYLQCQIDAHIKARRNPTQEESPAAA